MPTPVFWENTKGGNRYDLSIWEIEKEDHKYDSTVALKKYKAMNIYLNFERKLNIFIGRCDSFISPNCEI